MTGGHTDYVGIAALITAVSTSFVLVGGAIVLWRGQLRLQRTADDTHAQVVTLNESTLGELAASAETRRVEQMPHDDRTAQEQRHVDAAPEPEPPQGPSR
jgi:hypothetical protein